MNFADYENIAFKRRERVLEIILNRPDKYNAVDAALHTELARVFTDAANDAESDIIVLTGAGKAFSAGGDVNHMQKSVEEPERWSKTVLEGKQIVFSLLDCEKPIIAKVNGHATGLGATLALFCDVVFASETAKIGDPHVSVGLVAGDGGAIIWPQLIGYARAKEYLMTGQLMSASEAERIGLINHAVPPGELDAKVDAFVDRLAAGAPQAIRWTKVSVNIGLKQLAHSIMDTAIAYEWLSARSSDHREAVAAFLEKRTPKYTGR
jgi:enoyl-CoA hydratase